MTFLEGLFLFSAAVGAGVLNTVVGSGTLLTFPVLISIGVPPVQANIANNIGLAPGSISGAVGYRSELEETRSRTVRTCVAAGTGGVTGAVLLLVLPERIFTSVVPALIALAVVLVAVQPLLSRKLREKQFINTHGNGHLLVLATFLTSIYGGYFGAGQGVILLAIMSILMTAKLQQVNALKNVLQAVDNSLSALMFAVLVDVRWELVAILAAGAAIGGQIGAFAGKKIPEKWFRMAIIIIGVIGVLQWI